ncbi:MAG: ATP-binding cassette domain-containing protein [Deltaproteobacteria bacterium]|nr:ATP-binding cassette domain-containing protein [Deltaproteobacteria bacterium]
MLKVEDLSIEYVGIKALRNVSLRVEEKEIVSVIGANGGGKSTLLRTISGILKPKPGKIEFQGERIDGLPPHTICAKGLIQVPEGRQLFPRMKVMLAVARALMSMPKLLMLDEPSEGLSPVLTENVFSILHQLNDQGLTILLVSQEVAQSLELSSRAYILENSQIILEGRSTELMNNDKVRESYLGI